MRRNIMMEKDVITVVSGLPRSGTSMMMQMLEAGGLEILTDNLRRKDDDNPKGYYELESIKRLGKDQSCLHDARGKVVKVISELLKYLLPQYHYRVIFMRRKMGEILASQKQMLIRRGKPTDTVSEEKLAELFEKHLRLVTAWLDQQSNIDVLYIEYNALLQNPGEHIQRINEFLGNTLDRQKAAAIVDKTLYRQRR
jgi:hypothetical protein